MKRTETTPAQDDGAPVTRIRTTADDTDAALRFERSEIRRLRSAERAADSVALSAAAILSALIDERKERAAIDAREARADYDEACARARFWRDRCAEFENDAVAVAGKALKLDEALAQANAEIKRLAKKARVLATTFGV